MQNSFSPVSKKEVIITTLFNHIPCLIVTVPKLFLKNIAKFLQDLSTNKGFTIKD